PGVMVIHANQGLTAHDEDVVRRYARAGYAALAIDQLSRVGGVGSFPDAAEAMAAYARQPDTQQVADLNAALAYLGGLSAVRANPAPCTASSATAIPSATTPRRPPMRGRARSNGSVATSEAN